MDSLDNEIKGYIGAGSILATGLGVSAFILAVFALVYLNNKNIEDYEEERKKQMYNTAWAYMAFLIAFVVFAIFAAIANKDKFSLRGTIKDLKTATPLGRFASSGAPFGAYY